MDAPRSPLAAGSFPLSDAAFARLREWIYAESGIQLGVAKKALVVARLSRRLRALGLDSFDTYLRHVMGAAGAAERVHLLDAVTTNETRFFREPRQFEFLERTLFPAWAAEAAAGRRPRRVRAWSAGCATGEEPFSLAMSLLQAFPPESGFGLEIVASDLSTRVLEQARLAEWPLRRAEEIPAAHRKAWMLRGRGSREGFMRAGPALRALVRFQQLNLHAHEYALEGQFDLVLCRNVLIYFDAASRGAALERLVARLAPGGHLLLGHAESLRAVGAGVRSVQPTIYRRDDRAAEAA